MNSRLLLAFGAYAVLALLAWFTLDGKLRSAVLVLMGGLSIKTYIAHKARW